MPTDRKPNYAGAIYGTIVSMTIVATASKDPNLGSVQIAVWAAVTGIVFWMVHVYADIVTAGYSTFREAKGSALDACRKEWPIVQGAMIPALSMLVIPLFTLDDENASYWAIGGGIVMLFATGLFIGTRDNRSWGRRLLIGGINALFGAMILALKIIIH